MTLSKIGIYCSYRHWRIYMDIYLILRIAIVGLLVSIFNQILKQSNRDELAFLTSLAGLILVLFWLLPYIRELFTTIRELFDIL